MARPSTIDKHPKKEEILERLRNDSENLSDIAEHYGLSKTALWRTKKKLGLYDVKKTAQNEKAKELQVSQEEIDTNRFGRDLLADVYRIRRDLKAIQDNKVQENPSIAIQALKEQRAIIDTMVKVVETVKASQRADEEIKGVKQLKAAVVKIVEKHPELEKEIRKELRGMDD